jgi:hypothetical protein
VLVEIEIEFGAIMGAVIHILTNARKSVFLPFLLDSLIILPAVVAIVIESRPEVDDLII